MTGSDLDRPGTVWRHISRRRLLAGVMASGLAPPAEAALPPSIVWPPALTMGTGAMGSGFAVYGRAWGQKVHQATAIPLSYRVSGGGGANVLLIEQNAVQLAPTTLAVAASAWRGHATWTSAFPLRDFRALFPIYRASLQIIAPYGRTMIRPGDLDGALVGTGPLGSSSAVLVPLLLASLGITPRGFLHGGYAEQINVMLAGKTAARTDGPISACAFINATPSPAISAAARHVEFNLIGFTGAEIQTMRRILPGLESVVIPKGSLPRQSATVATIGTEAIAICRPELPDRLVSVITRAGLTNRAALLRAVPGMTVPAHNWLDGDRDIAIHPGAAQVLRRFNIAVPARLTRS